jgi:hypothetical protein
MERDHKWYRQICWRGVVEEIECGTEKTPHTYAWTGAIPCTGERRCIYCGKYEENVTQ